MKPFAIGDHWEDHVLRWIERAYRSGNPVSWSVFGAPFPGFGRIVSYQMGVPLERGLRQSDLEIRLELIRHPYEQPREKVEVEIVEE